MYESRTQKHLPVAAFRSRLLVHLGVALSLVAASLGIGMVAWSLSPPPRCGSLRCCTA